MSTTETVTIPISEYKALLSLHSEVDSLKGQLDYLKRQIFGQKTERYIPDNKLQTALSLGVESQESNSEIVTINSHTRTTKKKNCNHPGRTELPPHLPRERHIISPDCDTKDMVQIGEEVTEELEYIEASFKVIEYVRPVFAPKKGDGKPVIAALPFRPIEKGRPGVNLLVYLIISKFIDHLPLHRIHNQFKRFGVRIPESTLCDWVGAVCACLEPIHALIVNRIKKSQYLQVDETTLRVLKDSNAKKGKSKLGYLWPCHAVEEHLIYFGYFPSRSKAVANMILENHTGLLQTDGYAGYEEIASSKDVIHLGCMAHARREFEKALTNDRKRAQRALKYFRVLFAVESRAKDNKFTIEKRAQLRARFSVPVLKSFKKWMLDQIADTLPQSSIRKAINYSLNRWDKLSEYTNHPVAEISNNLIENLIRPIAIGRKNYLFAGSPAGAKRAAMIYSLVSTCKLNNVEPSRWLKFVIENINEWPASKLEELLPGNWNTLSKM